MESLFPDWRSLIAAVQIWLAGGNPYGRFEHPVGHGFIVHVGWYSYPPPTLLLAAPLTFLPWPVHSALMILMSVIGFERWVRATSQRVGLPWLILWIPFAQGFWIGQTTLLALVGFLWAEHAFRNQRNWQAAVLLNLALLKPQVGALAAAWLLFDGLRNRRWHFLAWFTGIFALLWGGTALLAGPQIYAAWIEGLGVYRAELPDRPLLFPPFGFVVGILAVLLWYRHGRGDPFGLVLLLNTLIYPLSVVYIAVAIAAVVIRWNPNWAWYPVPLSWIILSIINIPERTPDTITLINQMIIVTGLLAGLVPRLPIPVLFKRTA